MVVYYNANVLDDIDDSIKNHQYFDNWYEIVKDILLNDEFQRRKLFPHHHNMSVWEHVIDVSFRSYLLAKKWHADERICAIGGLLHDFYPYTWLYNKDLEDLDNGVYLTRVRRHDKLFQKHGFTHGKEASINYVKYFPNLENKKITNLIETHMFPLTIKPPRYKEGWIITLIDKRNSLKELPTPYEYIKGKLSKNNRQN